MKYIPPVIDCIIISIEESIASGSSVTFGGSTSGRPEIEDQPFEEKQFEIEF